MQKINQIGLTAVIFLVMSNMLGSGVFMLPATLAAIGGISLIAWLVAMIGVIALAITFAKLSHFYPHAAGPYDYTKNAFGEFIAYQTNFVYSLANWIANVSMLSVILGYLASIYAIFAIPTISALTQIIIIWLFTYLNIKGAKIVAVFQSSSLILALIPLIFLALFGWHWFDFNIFKSGWNITHATPIIAVNRSFNNIMWAFIGVESACVVARVVKNPQKNIAIATVGGVILATILYVSTFTVIMGIIPNQQLAASSAPFALVMTKIFGSKIALIVSLCAIINCLGSLAGWTMVIGQTAKAAALDGLFPKIFTQLNSKGVPAQGLIILAIFMSLVVLITISPNANSQFSKIVTMSVVLYLIPYIYSGFAIIVTAYKKNHRTLYLVNVLIALIAIIFCMWSILGSNQSLTVWAFLVMISSGLFYTFNQISKN